MLHDAGSMWICLVFGVHRGPTGFKISWDKDVGDVQSVLISDAPKFLAVQTLDCVMLAGACITDTIDIPSPNGNSYSTATREISLVFSPEMVAL